MRGEKEETEDLTLFSALALNTQNETKVDCEKARKRERERGNRKRRRALILRDRIDGCVRDLRWRATKKEHTHT